MNHNGRSCLQICLVFSRIFWFAEYCSVYNNYCLLLKVVVFLHVCFLGFALISCVLSNTDTSTYLGQRWYLNDIIIVISLMTVITFAQVHWLKTDFDKWRDEDDSDVDESKDAAFEDVS